jgi:integrase/recombinase XerD
MSIQSSHTVLLEHFADHLTQQRYCKTIAERYLAVAAKFLQYLRSRAIAVAVVEPVHVSRYLHGELAHFHVSHGHAPTSIDGWRSSHTCGIHSFLRHAKGAWPPVDQTHGLPDTLAQMLTDYVQWLREARGLASATISGMAEECARFLVWYRDQRNAESLLAMAVSDIDDYLIHRLPPLRRISRKGVSSRLRCFMRFVHATGRSARDFSSCILAPRIYVDEAVPSALRPGEIAAIVNMTRKDRSSKGLRDYAILMLLSTYGLRAGEITHLRLDDIDWHADKFLVRHTKTKSQTMLPLMPALGQALLTYLRHGRPTTDSREIFVRSRAPYKCFENGSSLYTPIRRRIEAAGIDPIGKSGPHTFRHARAVSLLRAGLPTKIIGDLLGHRSTASTSPYLKLAAEDLRAVALEVPGRRDRS